MALYKKLFNETRPFEDFMKNVDLQEIIGGYVMNEPGWRDAPYTTDQRLMLRKYMQQIYGQPNPK